MLLEVVLERQLIEIKRDTNLLGFLHGRGREDEDEERSDTKIASL